MTRELTTRGRKVCATRARRVPPRSPRALPPRPGAPQPGRRPVDAAARRGTNVALGDEGRQGTAQTRWGAREIHSGPVMTQSPAMRSTRGNVRPAGSNRLRPPYSPPLVRRAGEGRGQEGPRVGREVISAESLKTSRWGYGWGRGMSRCARRWLAGRRPGGRGGCGGGGSESVQRSS